MSGPDGFEIAISSSWIAGNGDVIEVGAYRVSSDGKRGKKLKPRRKRGKPLSDALRLEQLAKIASARERRRGGFIVGRRS